MMRFAVPLTAASGFPPPSPVSGSRRSLCRTQETMMLTSRCLRLSAPLLLVLMAATNDASGPQFSADGALIPPAGYREWVFLSSGLDMSKGEAPSRAGPSIFDNVFVDSASLAAFKQSGNWPDKTVFAMETGGASTKGWI